MATCEHCQNWLFDYVYGLLEESDIQQMREHLSACPCCQAALEKVQAQQNIFAVAARAISEVPEFVLPQDEPATIPPASSSAADAPTPARLPLASAPTPRRSLWRRPWVAWATAAALLVSVSAALSYYRRTIHHFEQQLTAQRQDYNQVEKQIAALPAKYQTLHQDALSGLSAEAKPYLHVVGPTQLQAGAKANLDITTRNVQGDLAPGTLRVKLVEADIKRVVQVTTVPSKGQAHVEIEAAGVQPHSQVNVVVEAETSSGKASLQQGVQVPPPQYVTRIDSSKLAYHIKEVLFFRVLVLERYSLKPPSQPILLHVKLLDPAKTIARQMLLWTRDGGILAGELAVEEHFLAGLYTLQVASFDRVPAALPILAANSASMISSPLGQGALLTVSTLIPGLTPATPVQAAALRLEILRQPQPADGLKFDKDRYYPGEPFTASLPGGIAPESAKLMIGNQPVPVTLEPSTPTARGASGVGGGTSAVGGGLGKQVDSKKATASLSPNRRIMANVPKNVPAGAKNLPLTLQLQEGKHKQEIKASLPLQPTDFAIDFFPEGGDLIAGVPNRVFYRLRSKAGEAVTGEGRVILLSNKNEIVDSPYQLGLGSLEFTPDAKETYTIRVTSPVKTMEIAQPFQKLKIRPLGVVLHVPAAVGKQGEPIQVTLRNQGHARKLLLVAQCRGQILDQRWALVKQGSQDFTLQTTQACGMIRVTAYEMEENVLEPIAERLVYRVSTQALQLGMTLNKQDYRPGQHIKATFHARNEKGEPTPAWLLATVVDVRFQTRPRSLSAYFLLLNEIRSGADLEDAQLILNDTPEAVQMLERFLGTHGWRRFVKTPALAGKASPPLIFSRESQLLETLQQQYEKTREARLTPIQRTAITEQVELIDRQLRLREALSLTLRARYHFEEQVQVWIRLGLGFVLALLLLSSLLLMTFGTYRILRERIATPAFGGAFVCLAICLMMLLLRNQIGPPDIAVPNLPSGNGLTAWEMRHQLDDLLTRAPVLKHAATTPAAGAYALASPRQESRRQDDFGGAAKADGQQEQSANSLAMLDQLAKLSERDAAQVESQLQAIPLNKMMDRYRAAKGSIASGPGSALGHQNATANDQKQTPAPPGAVNPKIQPAAIATATKKDENNLPAVKALMEGGAARSVEYAHEHAPNLMADTLLWSPALWLTKGVGEAHFDIASGQATYRVLLLGHTSSGQFGFYETRLDVSAVER